MLRVTCTRLFLAALSASCAVVPEPEPAGVLIAPACAWPVDGPPCLQLVPDRIALEACFARGGLLAGASATSAPDIDFGKFWCVLATDERRAGEPASAHLDVGEQGVATLAIAGRDPNAARARSARAWLVPRGKVTQIAIGALVVDMPQPASRAAVLPVLDVRGPAAAPASLHASWRITEPAELHAMRVAFGKAAPGFPADWVDPATECVVIARLPAGAGALQAMHVVEEEGVDVLTLETAAAGMAGESYEAHWIKLPRRERTLTLVHRERRQAGSFETVLGTWPPLR